MPIQTANAAIAQLGERQTEDLEVPSSILDCGIVFFTICWLTLKQRRTPGSCRKTQNPSNVSTNKVFTNQSSLTTLQEIPILLHERHRASLTTKGPGPARHLPRPSQKQTLETENTGSPTAAELRMCMLHACARSSGRSSRSSR